MPDDAQSPEQVAEYIFDLATRAAARLLYAVAFKLEQEFSMDPVMIKMKGAIVLALEESVLSPHPQRLGDEHEQTSDSETDSNGS